MPPAPATHDRRAGMVGPDTLLVAGPGADVS